MGSCEGKAKTEKQVLDRSHRASESESFKKVTKRRITFDYFP